MLLTTESVQFTSKKKSKLGLTITEGTVGDTRYRVVKFLRDLFDS